MKNLCKSFLFLIVATIFSLGAFAQSNIVSQSFEGSGTWNYVEFPNPYTVYSPPTDVWGICGNSLFLLLEHHMYIIMEML